MNQNEILQSKLPSEGLSPEQALTLMGETAKKNGADKWDAIAGESTSLGLELFETKVKSTEIAASRGAGIRLWVNGRPGFAFTERFTQESLVQTVKDALSHAALTDPLDLDLPDPVSLPDLDLESFNPAVERFDVKQMKSMCLELESRAREIDPRVESVPYIGAGRSEGSSIIMNSKGLCYKNHTSSLSAGLGVLAKHVDGSKKMGVKNQGGRDPNIFDAKLMAEEAVLRATELLGASPVIHENIPVVFSNRVSGQLLGMFFSSFYSDMVQKGQSRFEGKLHSQVASPIFNLRCDPHLKGWPGSRLFDGEGVPTMPKSLIEHGILKSFIHNLESAKKSGETPTGNGSRSYSGKVGTGFSNVIVAKGEYNLQELFDSEPRCYYIVKLDGGSGCSAISGQISIGTQGFLVEKGQIIQPIDRVTLNSNFFELLQSIQLLSNQYNDNFSSIKIPDILATGLHLAS